MPDYYMKWSFHWESGQWIRYCAKRFPMLCSDRAWSGLILCTDRAPNKKNIKQACQAVTWNGHVTRNWDSGSVFVRKDFRCSAQIRLKAVRFSVPTGHSSRKKSNKRARLLHEMVMSLKIGTADQVLCKAISDALLWLGLKRSDPLY